jgi:hypothetical protein
VEILEPPEPICVSLPELVVPLAPRRQGGAAAVNPTGDRKDERTCDQVRKLQPRVVVANRERGRLNKLGELVADQTMLEGEDAVRDLAVLAVHPTIADDEAGLTTSGKEVVEVSSNVLNRGGVGAYAVEALARRFHPHTAYEPGPISFEHRQNLVEVPDCMPTFLTAAPWAGAPAQARALRPPGATPPPGKR